MAPCSRGLFADVILTFYCHPRILKWCDHFGGALEKSRVIEGEDTAASEPSTVSAVSWTDRKKRDRAREKELLASVKYVKRIPIS